MSTHERSLHELSFTERQRLLNGPLMTITLCRYPENFNIEIPRRLLLQVFYRAREVALSEEPNVLYISENECDQIHLQNIIDNLRDMCTHEITPNMFSIGEFRDNLNYYRVGVALDIKDITTQLWQSLCTAVCNDDFDAEELPLVATLPEDDIVLTCTVQHMLFVRENPGDYEVFGYPDEANNRAPRILRLMNAQDDARVFQEYHPSLPDGRPRYVFGHSSTSTSSGSSTGSGFEDQTAADIYDID